MKNKFFLFDLDGTIIDSSEGIINSIKYSLDKMEKSLPDDEQLRKFIGPPLQDSFEKIIMMTKEEAEKAIDYFREYYQEHGKDEMKPYDNIEKVIKKLNEKYTLYVATSKYELFAHKILDNLNFSRYFKKIVGSNESGSFRKKGDIIKYILETEKLDIRKDEIYMTGDTEYDIIGANENNVRSIGVLYGFGIRKEFEKVGADWIIELPEDILTLSDF